MILGFTHPFKRNKAHIRHGALRVNLKFAWFPTKVLNKSLEGHWLKQEQWIWLETYIVTEQFRGTSDCMKWEQYGAVYIKPNKKLLDIFTYDKFKEYTSQKTFDYLEKVVRLPL